MSDEKAREEGTAAQGTWPVDCLQRAFVNGAAWMLYDNTGFTMFGSERIKAELEAVRRYGEPCPTSTTAGQKKPPESP